VNPFTLAGPQFLLFYAALAACLMAALVILRRVFEPAIAPRERLNNPYEIACLRGGVHEMLRVARVRLLDTRLLIRRGDEIEQAEAGSHPSFDDPIEEHVWRRFKSSAAATSVFELAPV